MTPLKSQTVYIPTEEMTDFYCSNDIGDAFSLIKQEKILLSKEQIIELLGKVFDGGIDRGIFDIGFYKKAGIPSSKEQFINNILQ